MSWQKTLPLWMLQICTHNIWSNCLCSFYHFYDTMELMTRATSLYETQLESIDAFSLAAACLLVSFRSLHGGELGVRTLQHLLVNCLQRKTHGNRWKVTFEMISQKLEEMGETLLVRNWRKPIRFAPLSDDRKREQLYLDMLHYINGVPGVVPPKIPGRHSDCISPCLDLAGSKIKWEELDTRSTNIASRIMKGCWTVEDEQICHEAHILYWDKNILHPGVQIVDEDQMTTILNLLKEVLVYRELLPILPQLSWLVPHGPKWIDSCQRVLKGTVDFKDS